MDEQVDLPLEIKAARLVLGHCFGQSSYLHSPTWDKLAWLIDSGLGGIKIYHGYPLSTSVLLGRMHQRSKNPFLVAADLERGLGDQFQDTIQFPTPFALATTHDPDIAFQEGFHVAKQAIALGINMVFGPIVSPAFPGIRPRQGLRVLGDDNKAAIVTGTSLLQGMRKGGAVCVLKYFPGWGRGQEREFISMASHCLDVYDNLIQAGAEAIMVSHNHFPELDNQNPAIFSPIILQRYLREQLGFQGLIVSDALALPWITQGCGIGEASCRAVEAGVDLVVALGKPEETYQAIAGISSALRSGRISSQRIDASLTRIERAYKPVSLNLKIEEIADKLIEPDSLSSVRAIAEASITVHHDRNQLLPLGSRPGMRLLVLTLGDGHAPIDPYRYWFLKEDFKELVPSTFHLVSPPTSQQESDLFTQALNSNAIIVAFTGGERCSWIHSLALKLSEINVPVIGIWFDYPSDLEILDPLPTLIIAFSFDEPAQAAAMRIIFCEKSSSRQ